MNNRTFIFISFLFFSLWNDQLYARGTAKFTHISVEDGLSQNIVYSIFQDNQGYMWFGTQDAGLNRYDGYTFTNFLHNPKDSLTLPSNNVGNFMTQDKNGLVWMGSWGAGLICYNPIKETFVSYRHNPVDSTSINNNRIQSGLIARDGTMWIGTAGGGLNKLIWQSDPKGNSKPVFKHYKHDPGNPNSISNDRIWAIAEDSRGHLWLGTSDGLNDFDPQTGNVIRYQSDPRNPNSLSNSGVARLHIDKDGIIWIGSFRGLNRLEPKTNKITRFYPDPDHPDSEKNTIYSFCEDYYSNFWIGTRASGLYLFNRQTLKFETNYYHDPQNPYSLGDGYVNLLYEDKSHMLWISVEGSGLYKLDLKPPKFFHYSSNPFSKQTLSHNYIESICEDDSGFIWVGTNKGINRFEPSTELFIPLPSSIVKEAPYSNRTPVIFNNHKGKLLISFVPNTIVSYDQMNQHINSFAPQLPTGIRITCLIENKSGEELYFGTTAGLFKFDIKTKLQTAYYSEPNNPMTISDYRISTLYEDSQGVIWIGTENGFNAKPNDDNNFIRYLPNTEINGSLVGHKIFYIMEDKDNILWVGTSSGLNMFNRENQTFTHFSSENGLAADAVYGILQDNTGLMWISTNKGLSRFDPVTKKFYNFYIQDGLQSNEFIEKACYKSQSGEMYFGGVNGFNRFHPEKIQFNRYIPSIVITDFQVADQPFNINTYLFSDQSLILSFNENFLSFQFSALDYTSPISNKYAYMLEGLDPDWVKCGNQRYARYHYVEPGQYTLRIIGSNNDGMWNNEGVSLRIIITPPWWKTWWAYLIYGFMLVTSILSVYFWRVRNLHARRKELEHQVAVKTLELRQKFEELESLYKVNLSLISTLDLHNLLKMIIEAAIEAVPHAEKGSILLLNETTQRLEMKACVGYDEQLYAGFSVEVDESFAGKAIKEHRSLIVNSVSLRENLLNPHTGDDNIKSAMVALMASNQRIIGTITVDNFRVFDAFDEKSLRLLDTFAAQAAIAIEKAMLYEELEKRNDSLQQALSSLQSAQKQLVESEKMAALGQLVAGVAHEVNTPVGVSITAASYLEQQAQEFIKLIESGKAKRSELTGFLDVLKESSRIILTNLQRAAELVQSFKQVAVDQSNEQPRTFKVKEYLDEILLNLRPQLKRRPITVEIDCPAEVQTTNYPGAFAQIVTNLVMNSLIHAYEPDQSGVLNFSIYPNNSKWQFIYHDDGKGMSPEVMTHAFDPFFTTKRNTGGSGLGLHIVYNLVVQRLHGSIKLSSEINKGTTFHIELPLILKEESS